ncbi:Uncharacterized 50 kDa protein in type I retrotransposable element R1DM [Anthophora quadrimaculata]
METPTSRSSKRPRPQVNPSECTTDQPSSIQLISLETFNRFDDEIRGHVYNLEQTIPAKEVRARTCAINDAMSYMRLLYSKISRAYVDLAARYQEILLLKDQFVSVINSNMADKVCDEIASVKQQIEEHVVPEIQKILNVNAEQRQSLETNVGKRVADSISNAICSFEDSVTAKLLPQRKSYASVVDSSASSSPSVVAISKSQTIAITKFKEFTVEPLPEKKTNFTDSKNIKNVMLAKIDPRKFNIRARKVITLRNLAVRIVAETVDLDKLKTSRELKELGLRIRDKLTLQPRILIRNVPENIKPESIPDEICMRNLTNANSKDIKVIFQYPAIRNRADRNIVIEVTPVIRNQIINKRSIYIGYGSCRVEDHLRITQCYKCAKFGHIAKECSQNYLTCGKCMQDHLTKDCTITKELLKCRNCHDFNHENKNHSAFDAEACPILAKRLADRARSVNYSTDE